MLLSDELMLTVEDIRYLRPTHLAALTKIPARYFSAWSANRSMSETSIKTVADALGIDREEVLKAFDLRRRDWNSVKAAEAKALKLMSHLKLQKESA
jgi:hypothetical protein